MAARRTYKKKSKHLIWELPAGERAAMNAGLTKLGHGSYIEYSRSSHWRGIRRRWRKSYCENCGGKWKLCLHHVTYRRLGHELKRDLVTLCSVCHRAVHTGATRRGHLYPAHMLRMKKC